MASSDSCISCRAVGRSSRGLRSNGNRRLHGGRSFLRRLPASRQGTRSDSLSLSLLIRAQKLPSFEVASVKPHPIGGITGNWFREVMVNLSELIIDAYKVKNFQIIGLPSWGSAGTERFDVEARGGECRSNRLWSTLHAADSPCRTLPSSASSRDAPAPRLCARHRKERIQTDRGSKVLPEGPG